MKRLFAATSVALFAASASLAGGMSEPVVEAEPVMEPEVVVSETGSSGGFVVPLMLVALIAAVASGD